MGAGTNSLAYSYNGFTWVGLGTALFQINIAATVQPFGSFAWNNAIWVAVCTTSVVGNNFLYSYDGINWIPNGSGGLPSAVSTYTNVYWNGNLFLATCNGQASNYNMAYSYDGVQWYYCTTATTSTLVGGAAWNGAIFSALGSSGTTGSIYTSNDGIKWLTNRGNTNIPTITAGNSFSCMAYNGQIWLVCQNGPTTCIAYSYDGLYWNNITPSVFAYGINNLAWNGYLWIACGRTTNTLVYSYNGINWFPCAPQVTTGATNLFTTNCFYAAWNGRRENILYFPQNRTLLLGASNSIGNTIAYSFDGSGGWIPSLYNTTTVLNPYATNRSPFLFSSANGAGWNGYMWVVGGTVNTNPYYTSGNTIPSSLNFTNNTAGTNVSYFSNSSTALFVNAPPTSYTIEAWIRSSA
jgi:hypothetical protein